MGHFLVLLEWGATSGVISAGGCADSVCVCCNVSGSAGHLSLALAEHTADDLTVFSQALKNQLKNPEKAALGRMSSPDNTPILGSNTSALQSCGFSDIKYLSFWCEPRIFPECICKTLFCCCAKYTAAMKTTYAADHKEEKRHPKVGIVQINEASYVEIKARINQLQLNTGLVKWSFRYNCSSIVLECVKLAQSLDGGSIYTPPAMLDCKQCGFSTPKGVFANMHFVCKIDAQDFKQMRQEDSGLVPGASSVGVAS